jgi:hypothetical protein
VSYSVGFVASAARTTSSNSTALRVDSAADNINVAVFVTAASGTPSMILSVEWSNDGINFAAVETPDAFTAITGTGNKVKSFPVRGLFARIVWVITGGTPSLTFSVDVGSAGRPLNVAYG